MSPAVAVELAQTWLVCTTFGHRPRPSSHFKIVFTGSLPIAEGIFITVTYSLQLVLVDLVGPLDDDGDDRAADVGRSEDGLAHREGARRLTPVHRPVHRYGVGLRGAEGGNMHQSLERGNVPSRKS